jgi:hypothetical protein
MRPRRRTHPGVQRYSGIRRLMDDLAVTGQGSRAAQLAHRRAVARVLRRRDGAQDEKGSLSLNGAFWPTSLPCSTARGALKR